MPDVEAWRPVDGLTVYVGEGVYREEDLENLLEETMSPIHMITREATVRGLILTEKGKLTPGCRRFAHGLAVTSRHGLKRLEAVHRHAHLREEEEERLARMEGVLGAVMALAAIASQEGEFPGWIYREYEWEARDPINWMVDLVKWCWDSVETDSTLNSAHADA